MMLKLKEQFEKAGSLVNESNEEQTAVRDYMICALGVYQEHTYIGTRTGFERTDILMKFMGLVNEALGFHTEGAAPESEEAQKFIKTFWETLLAYTDGNMDLM